MLLCSLAVLTNATCKVYAVDEVSTLGDGTSQVPGNVPEDDVAGIIAHLVNTGVKNGDFRRFKGKSIGVRTYLSKTSEEGAKY